MCINQKEIFNPHTNQHIFVKCGKCESCLQEKADKRANKIRANHSDQYTTLFFTLTYADAYLPYFYISDLLPYRENYVHIYRDHEVRRYYSTKNKVTAEFSTIYGKELDILYNRDCTIEEVNKLYDVGFGRCGVLYYPDVQKFFKRLRHNLERDAQYKYLLSPDGSISYFVCGEYGEGSQLQYGNSRPHWHILLRVPRWNILSGSQFLQLWKRAVCQSWLYAFPDVTERRFEIARNASAYVSSYVNSSVDVSSFLKRDDFRAVWHYSKGYGLAFKPFLLDEILKKVDNGLLQYNIQYTRKDGQLQNRSVSYPEYVLDRYFPRFKGFFRLSPSELDGFIRSGIESRLRVLDLKRQNGSKWYLLNNYLFQVRNKLDLDDRNIHDIVVRVYHCFERFRKDSGLGLFDYAYYYAKVHRLRFKNLMMIQYAPYEQPSDIFQRYDNLYKILNSKKFYLLNSFGYWLQFYDCDYIVHPNKFESVVSKTSYMRNRYFSYVKQRQVNSVRFKN